MLARLVTTGWNPNRKKINSPGYNFGIGNDLMIANRVSFEYDLKGPRYVRLLKELQAIVYLSQMLTSGQPWW